VWSSWFVVIVTRVVLARCVASRDVRRAVRTPTPLFQNPFQQTGSKGSIYYSGLRHIMRAPWEI
jgi:hypothetical protein